MKTEVINKSNGFIPLQPDKKRRFKQMMAASVPAFVLISASFNVPAETYGSVILKYFNIVAGVIILAVNYMGYKYPEKKRILGLDMTLVLSGLLILAQGASSYDPFNGFQPTHLVFMAGTLFIFKGVMLPEAKIKRGFTITENEIIFREKYFSKNVIINRDELIKIIQEKRCFQLLLSNKKIIEINMKDYENTDFIFSELTRLTTTKKEQL